MGKFGISANKRGITLIRKQNTNPTASGKSTVCCRTGELEEDAKISPFTTILFIKNKIVADTMPSYVSRITQHFFELPCPYS